MIVERADLTQQNSRIVLEALPEQYTHIAFSEVGKYFKRLGRSSIHPLSYSSALEGHYIMRCIAFDLTNNKEHFY